MIRMAQVLSWDHLVRQVAEPLAEGLELYGTERRQPFPSGFEVGRRSRGVEGCEHPYPGRATLLGGWASMKSGATRRPRAMVSMSLMSRHWHVRRGF